MVDSGEGGFSQKSILVYRLFTGFLQLSLVKGMMMELGVGEVVALSLRVSSCDLGMG